MFIESKEVDQGSLTNSDICIIGAGAAGISMAHEFVGTSYEVTVLESGGLTPDQKTQSLYTGTNIGLPSFNLETNRLRAFGGTTALWAGHCRPLDSIDFKVRNWMPHSGWPITRADLDPYYERTQPIVELGPYNYEDLGFYLEKTGLKALSLMPSRLKSVVYNQSPPTRFATTYQEELRRAKNIGVYLHSNVLELESNPSSTEVVNARVGCIDGPTFSVSAHVYILATGGMENARLLLLSDSVNPKGLGNEMGLVGRYFMDHLLLRPGADISLTRPDIDLRLYHALHSVQGGKMFSVLASTEKLMQAEKLANFRMHLYRHGPRFTQSLASVFKRIDQNGQVNTNASQSVALHLVLEPIPNPDSRIQLTNNIDILGQRKISVDWKITDSDIKSAHRAFELAGLEFGRLALGRAFGEILNTPDKWPSIMEAGKHHSGTTRMSDQPSTGVVDRNCKVHDIANLYVAGSSVFPTIGYANPTLTIIALALRLADHLKGALR